MKTYQTLSLIGCILGILTTIGLFITMGIGSSLSESFSDRQEQEEFNSTVQPFMTGLAFAFIFYIIALVLTFVLRNKVVIGIILLVLGGISIPITNGYGIIPFALLLPAAIVAFRQRHQKEEKEKEGIT